MPRALLFHHLYGVGHVEQAQYVGVDFVDITLTGAFVQAPPDRCARRVVLWGMLQTACHAGYELVGLLRRREGGGVEVSAHLDVPVSADDYLEPEGLVEAAALFGHEAAHVVASTPHVEPEDEHPLP